MGIEHIEQIPDVQDGADGAIRRIDQKIKAAREAGELSIFETEVLNGMEADAESLVYAPSSQGESAESIQKDLSHRMEQARLAGDAVQEQVLQNLWNLVDGRGISIKQE